MKHSFVKPGFICALVFFCCLSCAEKKSDNSLTINAYRELGLPDPAKKWDMGDYTQAHNVLAKLKWEKPLQLPVKDSDRSGPLFKHMVSLDYLSFLRDRSITRSEKAQLLSEFGAVYDYWMDIYTVPTADKNYYNREIVDVRILNLKLTEAAFNLANEINKSDDPADIALQYGYGSIKRAYIECLNNYLQPRTHALPQGYALEFSDEDMQLMVDSIHQSVLRNKKWFNSNELSGLKHSLRSAMDSTSSNQIRDKYKQLANQLES